MNKYNIGDILINKYSGEYYIVNSLEGIHTYVSILNHSEYQSKYIDMDYYFTIVSKA